MQNHFPPGNRYTGAILCPVPQSNTTQPLSLQAHAPWWPLNPPKQMTLKPFVSNGLKQTTDHNYYCLSRGFNGWVTILLLLCYCDDAGEPDWRVGWPRRTTMTSRRCLVARWGWPEGHSAGAVSGVPTQAGTDMDLRTVTPLTAQLVSP